MFWQKKMFLFIKINSKLKNENSFDFLAIRSRDLWNCGKISAYHYKSASCNKNNSKNESK